MDVSPSIVFASASSLHEYAFINDMLDIFPWAFRETFQLR
jgi:hypothetical protein